MTIQDIETFIAIIESAIDKGNINDLEKALKDYGNKIPKNYIANGKSILYELLIEKMEAIQFYNLFK